ncbi:hypothetical protein INT45_003951 [Circinella minor]|uniref:Galactose oxidase n=1 Tax=Circinella minor TaxID=1195481 RepID=A0A8H7RXK3_9FUNG|nr:hypothetical protein INT45_003951 [Circinella minor]
MKVINNFIWWSFYFSFLSIYYDNKNGLAYAQQQPINIQQQNGVGETDFNPLVNPLLNPVRKYAATFFLPDRDDNTAYVWGGEGRHSTGAYRDIVPYFNSIQINVSSHVTFQNVTYNFVENSRDYKNFATAASAVVDPHNSNRVLFFGGFRESLFGTSEDGPLYVEQYDFSNSQWTSITPAVASSSSDTSTTGTITPPRNRAYLSAIATQGNIYIAGGIGTDSNRTVDTVNIWMYDSVNQVFSPAVQGNVSIGGGPYESIDGFVLSSYRRDIGYTEPRNVYQLVFTNRSSAGNTTGGGDTEWSWTTSNRDDSLQEYQGSRYGASVIVNTTSYTVWRMFVPTPGKHIVSYDQLYFDVRLCVRGLVAPNVSCTKADIRGCPNEEPIQFTNSRIYPNSTYKPSRLGTECWYSQGGGMLEYDDTLQFQLQYGIDDAAGDHSLQIEVYPQRSANPNIYLYYTPEQQNAYFLPNIVDPTPPDQQSIISWAMQDVQYDGPTLNRYTIDLTMQNRPIIAYQHETHRSLSSSPWNVFGFASSYDEDLKITTTFQTGSITPRINNTAGGVSYSTIVLWPSQMADITLQEQRVYPLVSVLGSVGGLLALLITINGFLYGTRPNSPWGAVHNFFGFKTSLQQNLYNKFGFMGRPIPLIHPVDPLLFDNNKKHFKDLIQKYHYFPGMVEQQNLETIHSSETKRSSTTAIHQPDYIEDIVTAKNMEPESSSSSTTNDNNVDPHQLELELVEARLESYAQSHRELQQRIQFLEVMLKSYYINDEVMKGLNSAYENEKVKKFIMDDDDYNDMTIDMDPFRLRNSIIRSRFAPDLQRPFYRHRQKENNDDNHRSKNNTSSGDTITASSNDDRSEDSPFIKDQ